MLSHTMPEQKSPAHNLVLLIIAQALLFTNNVTLIAINGLAGLSLAGNKALATLPIACWVISTALMAMPASLHMRRAGRRAGFMFGTTFGLVGCALCSLAIYLHAFWLLCAGTFVFGGYNAYAQYYRFAAADVAPPQWKSKAISWVMAGGIVGGILGPETSKLTRGLFEIDFLGAYLVLGGVLLVALAVQSALRIPPQSDAETSGEARPLGEIARQPAFLVAVVGAAVGYGMMNLLMTATPLAMGFCGHPYADAAFVIEWHVIGMFAPSFFTGNLIRRFGALQVMFCGALLQAACASIALSGSTVNHFWMALVLLGVGWNFLYIGGTTLLTETYRPAEKARVQGLNDLLVAGTTGVTSLASGVLLDRAGWETLNWLALPVIGVVLVIIAWRGLGMRRRLPAV
ncbi:MAG: MFS transporter [Rhodocyclaceae bacterium]